MNTKRMDLLDIVKGLMIIFIVITHFRFEYPEDYQKYGFFYWIDMAVPVFMIITSYLTALQMEKQKITSIKAAWAVERVIPKILRFIIPFLPAFLIEIPMLVVEGNYSFADILQTLVRGGEGPGSYYTPIMLQAIFIIPLIYFVVRRYDFFGTVLCFCVTAMWEFIQYSWGMDKFSYALIILRYVSIIAFGCFIAIGKVRLSNFILALLFVVGIVWQTFLNYMPLHPLFMNFEWARVNYISVLFIMPILYLIIRRYADFDIKVEPLQQLGKASYNIFLVQMVFYGCGPASLVYRLVRETWIQLLICIAINLGGGYLYYCVDRRLSKRIIEELGHRGFYIDKFERLADTCNRVVGM